MPIAPLVAAFDAPLTNNLFEAMIPGFALHWDFPDLRKAMGQRLVLWTDPTNWMGHVVSLGDPLFQYRWVLGDITEMSDAQDLEYARELMR